MNLSRNQFIGEQEYIAAPGAPVRESRLDRAVNHLRQTNEMLAMGLGELESLNSRVLGSEPVAGSTSLAKAEAVPNGMLDELQDAIRRTNQLAEWINAQIERAKAIG